MEATFSKFGNRGEVVTEAGHHEKQLPPASQAEESVNVVATQGVSALADISYLILTTSCESALCVRIPLRTVRKQWPDVLRI